MDEHKRVEGAETTVRDMSDGYMYVFMDTDRQVEIRSVTPPEELLRVMGVVAEFLGFRWDELSIAIYTRAREGEAWQPIHGTDVTDSVLFPLPSKGNVKMKDSDYYNIGRKILQNYVVMREWAERLRANSALEETTRALADLEANLRTIEMVVEGTEMQRLFDYKYKQGQKQYVCAAKLHMSPRTLNRKLHAMAVYIGRILHATLKPRRLQQLMRVPDEWLGNIS
ncbi:hypothetical protein [Alicyclobacillus macrosporangiidus]|uniref:Uncharacterized protein n=1 Tax=Alicyclobacillus macrosporangiidus TaxID=392015 RepID=A0A1I7KE08_9BACL|nr:hypothetical protein [Alicyclobacillus macrosporangiidus]SFU95634.1 hypothetical protein SAMN05421543_11563 [Alicyclobacillus macrosporangiidus]